MKNDLIKRIISVSYTHLDVYKRQPYGYTLNENYYEVNVDSNTAYQMDGTYGDVIIEIA